MALYKKRERTQNWTQEEKILLLKLCGTKINILENKKADQYSLTIKNSVWKEIHQEFIAKLGTDRDVLRLKEQWQRMKKQARSELQDFRAQTRKQQGDLIQQQQQRKISNISEEVLKIMDIANKHNNNNTSNNNNNNNHEEDDVSISNSSENSEQDNTPTYFCETEVKPDIDGEIDHEIHQKTKLYTTTDDSEASLSSLTAVINSQAKLKYNNNNNNNNNHHHHLHHKNESILHLLTNMYHQNSDAQERINVDNNRKRKFSDNLEDQFLQSLFEAKHKEHLKRLMIIEEQLKTAKVQRETAEIQKQIAQQELKHLLLESTTATAAGASTASTQREKKNSTITIINGQIEPKGNNNNKDVVLLDNVSNDDDDKHYKIVFHQNQIKMHEEEIEKHRQILEGIVVIKEEK